MGRRIASVLYVLAVGGIWFWAGMVWQSIHHSLGPSNSVEQRVQQLEHRVDDLERR